MGRPPWTAADAPPDPVEPASARVQATRRDDLVVWGYASAALALLAPLLGILAISLGEVARRSGDPRGGWVAVAGMAGLVAGAFLGIVVFRLVFPDLWSRIAP